MDAVLGEHHLCVIYSGAHPAHLEDATKCAMEVWRIDDPDFSRSSCQIDGNPVLFGLSNIHAHYVALVKRRAVVCLYDISHGPHFVRSYRPPPSPSSSPNISTNNNHSITITSASAGSSAPPLLFHHYARTALSEHFVAADADQGRRVFVWARESGILLHSIETGFVPSAAMRIPAPLRLRNVTLLYAGPGNGLSVHNLATGVCVFVCVRARAAGCLCITLPQVRVCLVCVCVCEGFVGAQLDHRRVRALCVHRVCVCSCGGLPVCVCAKDSPLHDLAIGAWSLETD